MERHICMLPSVQKWHMGSLHYDQWWRPDAPFHSGEDEGRVGQGGDGEREEREGGVLIFVCLAHLTVDQAPLSRQRTVPTGRRGGWGGGDGQQNDGGVRRFRGVLTLNGKLGVVG